MSLWEHFDHSELNPHRDRVGKTPTPSLHTHPLHPDSRTGHRQQPGARKDKAPWATGLLLVSGRGLQRCALDTGDLAGHTTVEDILELELQTVVSYHMGVGN